MTASVRSCCIGMMVLVSVLLVTRGTARQVSSRSVLLEVIRNSWNVERDETLVYVRVYSDGFAEAHSMKKVDFRDIQLSTKQLPSDELAALNNMLSDPATGQLDPKYSRYWGNKDFGYKYIVVISGGHKQIELGNFQPSLARKEAKPYPKQVEKLGCLIWKLRAEVSGEPLERNWLKWCSELGY